MMNRQVMILSGDAVFARMLELEFSALGIRTGAAAIPEPDGFAEVLLWDLDSAPIPPEGGYGQLFGFTREAVLPDVAAKRQCGMILRRPFEVRILREEVFSALGTPPRFSTPETRQKLSPKVILGRDGVFHDGEREVRLSPKEAALLRVLTDHAGECVTREELSRAIGESGANKTEVYICFLRKKTDRPGGGHLIRTVRGKGYLFESDPENRH